MKILNPKKWNMLSMDEKRRHVQCLRISPVRAGKKPG